MPSFHRRIELRTCSSFDGGRHVRAALEDDFHHFRIEMFLDSTLRVLDLRSAALRHPYSLCPRADAPLRALVGTQVQADGGGVAKTLVAQDQCTHLFDLAVLACAAAARGAGARRYDVEVPIRIDGRTRATLLRDGAPFLGWDVEGMIITAPAPYIGVDLLQGIARWAATNLPPEEAEAALVLRRCAVISRGKGMPLDSQVHARPTGLCFAQQPERAPLALRQVGSTWDFSGRARMLCAEDETWVSFVGERTA